MAGRSSLRLVAGSGSAAAAVPVPSAAEPSRPPTAGFPTTGSAGGGRLAGDDQPRRSPGPPCSSSPGEPGAMALERIEPDGAAVGRSTSPTRASPGSRAAPAAASSRRPATAARSSSDPTAGTAPSLAAGSSRRSWRRPRSPGRSPSGRWTRTGEGIAAMAADFRAGAQLRRRRRRRCQRVGARITDPASRRTVRRRPGSARLVVLTRERRRRGRASLSSTRPTGPADRRTRSGRTRSVVRTSAGAARIAGPGGVGRRGDARGRRGAVDGPIELRPAEAVAGRSRRRTASAVIEPAAIPTEAAAWPGSRCPSPAIGWRSSGRTPTATARRVDVHTAADGWREARSIALPAGRAGRWSPGCRDAGSQAGQAVTGSRTPKIETCASSGSITPKIFWRASRWTHESQLSK